MACSFEVVDRAHCKLLLRELNEQRMRGSFCDVTIVVQDSKFKAHKNILAAFSCYFRERLTGPSLWAMESVLELREMRAEVFAKILNFIYSSQVVIERLDEADALASAGHRLGIHFLKDLLQRPPQPAPDSSSSSLSPPSSAPLPRWQTVRKHRGNAATYQEGDSALGLGPREPFLGPEALPGPTFPIDLTDSSVRLGGDSDRIPPAPSFPPQAPSGQSGQAATGEGEDSSSASRDGLFPADGTAQRLLTLNTVAIRGLGFNVEQEASRQLTADSPRPLQPEGPNAAITPTPSSCSSAPLSDTEPRAPGGAELSCQHCLRPFVHLKRLQSHQTACRQGGGRPGMGREAGSAPQAQGASRKSRRRDVALGSEVEDHMVKVVDGHILYFCAVCERSYVTLSSLKRHANVHSWHRKYPCHFCDKVFALAEYRTKHEVWHTGERRYQCIFCWEAFVTYYNLKTHQKSFHGVDPGLTISQKTANGGYKPKLNAFKLYRLLPMRNHKRPYKTYSRANPSDNAPVETPHPTAPVETPHPTVPMETPHPIVAVGTPHPTVAVETPHPTVAVETPHPTVPVETPHPTVAVETSQPTITVETFPPTAAVETFPPTAAVVAPHPTVTVETALPTVPGELPPSTAPAGTAPPTVPVAAPAASTPGLPSSLRPEGSTALGPGEPPPPRPHQQWPQPLLGPEGVVPGHSVITYGGPQPPPPSSSSVIVAPRTDATRWGQSTVIAYNGKHPPLPPPPPPTPTPPGHREPSTITRERPVSGWSAPCQREALPSSSSAPQGQKEQRGPKAKRPPGGAAEGRTMTYVAKPACPGAASEGRSAPLCRITVRIGEEALVKRRIAESDLIRDEAGQRAPPGGKRGPSCEEASEGEHQPRVRRRKRRRRRRRRRSDGYSLGQDSEEEDSDLEDNLWRPYYSYKPKQRVAGSFRRSHRAGWHRRLRYRHPPAPPPPPSSPPPPGGHPAPRPPQGPSDPRDGGERPLSEGVRTPHSQGREPAPRGNSRKTATSSCFPKMPPSAPGRRPTEEEGAQEGDEEQAGSRPDPGARLSAFGVDLDAAIGCLPPTEETVAHAAQGEGNRAAQPQGGAAEREPAWVPGTGRESDVSQGDTITSLVPQVDETRAAETVDPGGVYNGTQPREDGDGSPGTSGRGADTLLPQEASHDFHTLEPEECRRAGTGLEYPVQEYPIPLLTNGNCCPHSKAPGPERVKPGDGGLSKVAFYQDPYPLMYGHQLLTGTYSYPIAHVSPLPLALNMVIRDEKAQHLPLLQRMFVYPTPCLGDATPLGTAESGGRDEAGGRELVAGQKGSSLY
ncbi:zinc finger and BTB domain-containing protein 4-like [Stegostoma tigrinum]|uniref:zinc finger and BTB domain-containing protein 4-like n=1 Tax=Stegostoma tigrinum TaxID=3053191 RepID=UPI0028702A6B|nr:zinc finger and BTB domain-containing protein 4-like [Stegostoma tigrinum]